MKDDATADSVISSVALLLVNQRHGDRHCEEWHTTQTWVALVTKELLGSDRRKEKCRRSGMVHLCTIVQWLVPHFSNLKSSAQDINRISLSKLYPDPLIVDDVCDSGGCPWPLANEAHHENEYAKTS